MARDESPPFERGATYYNGETIDANNLGGSNLEGKVFVFEPASADASDPSGRPITVKVVRNKSGAALKGGRIAHFKASDPYETQVDGYTFAVGDRPAGVIDEFLPPAGVPNNDLFYVVIDGPTKVTQLSASAANLAIGDRLVPGAGTSATDDDAGRVNEIATATPADSATTTALFNNIQNCIGFAAEANAATADKLVKAVVHLA